MPTAKRVRELFDYDKSTGLFTRRITVGRHGRFRKGETPGTENGNGYVRMYVDSKRYYAHRLAWLHTFGSMPSQLDHIDGDRSNNRIDNLRISTQSQNLANRTKSPRNKSGFKGVCRDDRYIKKWKAQITINRKNIYLGTFLTAKEAYAAYLGAAKIGHKEFHHP